MCGIAGIHCLSPEERPRLFEIDQMIATMLYRGPDACGRTLVAPQTALGHARLSILDLSAAANQPFVLDEGELSVTYNGEIYNYIELAQELGELGHRFRTTSDTEVLLTAYKEWGLDFVTRLNGMWAFAIYDARRELLLCSRDRFGVKPFYYALTGGRFVFASEIKALLTIDPSLRKVNYGVLSAFLRSGVHSEVPETFFAGVSRLMPAHNLVVTRDKIVISRYWDYPTHQFSDIGAEEAAERLRELLVDSIRLRMRSDVPVGATLSGGVDSSALVCLLREVDHGARDTFTAAFPGESFDEAPTAGALADRLGMRSHPIAVGVDHFLPVLEQVVHHMDSPTQCPAVLPLWHIMERMRGRVVVALEGQGADELLGGYVDILLPYEVIDAIRLRRVGEAAATVSEYSKTWGWRTGAIWSGRAAAPWSHKAFRRWRGDEAVYSGPLKDAASVRPAESGLRFGDAVTAKLHEQHSNGLLTLLHYGDAVSMAHSIESRLPFLDYRLVEFGFRLPGRLKVRRGEGKLVLKDAVRHDVPPGILSQKRKLGFATPISRWFRTAPERTIYPVLRSARARGRGLFDVNALDRAVQRHIDGKVDLSSQIFRWITTEQWLQRFVDGD